MGYRSQVAIALRDEDAEKLKQEYLKMAEGKNEQMFCQNIFSGCTFSERHTDDGRTVFHWREIAWYDGYRPDVTFVMKFVRSCESYDYLRIGEDPVDDIQRESTSEEGLPFWPNCTIEFDC